MSVVYLSAMHQYITILWPSNPRSYAYINLSLGSHRPRRGSPRLRLALVHDRLLEQE